MKELAGQTVAIDGTYPVDLTNDVKELLRKAQHNEYEEHDPVRGKAILQRHGDRLLVVNPPAMPLTTAELDFVAELPYVREPHPMYDEMGGRACHRGGALLPWPTTGGCFGACNFLLPGLPPGADHTSPQP
mgnify:CR=1 FL=1